MKVNKEGLELLNSLSMVVHAPYDSSWNRETEEFKILSNVKSVELEIDGVPDENYDYSQNEKEIEYKQLTEEELSKICIEEKKISLYGFAGKKKFVAPNKKHFTVGDMINCIREVEKLRIGMYPSDHVFFEGVSELNDGSFDIYWGS